MPSEAEVGAQLRGMFPPGAERVIDWDDEPGALTDAIGAAVKRFGFDLAEQLFLEMTPLTCRDLLPWWERALHLVGSKIAVSGTRQQRINQVLSRLRERGQMTLGKIQRVVAPLLDYADPSTLVVLKTDRAALRTLHTRTSVATITFNNTPSSFTIPVVDRAKVSKGGAQVDVSLSALADLNQLRAELIAPDGRSITVQRIGHGSGVGVWRLYFRGMYGAQIAGNWTLRLSTRDGSAGSATQASLFVEGVGREAGLDGLGAAIFYWGPVVDPALIGPGADLDAAADAIRRINHATRNGRIIRKSTVAAATCVCPDEDAAIPDECIPC